MFSIVLLNANILGEYGYARNMAANMGIASIHSYINTHSKYNVNIIDAWINNFSPEEVAEKVIFYHPDVLGISMCVQEAVKWTNLILDLVKKRFPTIYICIGNYFPSLLPKEALEMMPYVDSIVMGEGEITFMNLLECIQKKTNWQTINGIAFRNPSQQKEVTINPRRELIQNVDFLPWPKRYLLTEENSANAEAMIEGSRGCFFSCGFCAIRPFYGSSKKNDFLRMRTARNIIDEILFLRKKYPSLKNFGFVDPDFMSLQCRDRAFEFGNLLIEKNMDINFRVDTRPSTIIKNIPLLKLLKSAGLARIFLGIESGSQYILNKLRKGITVNNILEAISILKEVNIDYVYGFMMITRWTKEKDIEENISLLTSIGHVGFHKLFSELMVIPGTYTYNELQQKNLLIKKNKCFEITYNKETDKRRSWADNLYYYTYKSSSSRIENIRKIKIELQKTHNDFFQKISCIYDCLCVISYKDQEVTQKFWPRIDKISLDIFKYCWDQAKNGGSQELIKSISYDCTCKYYKETKEIFNDINIIISKLFSLSVNSGSRKVVFPFFAQV